MKNPHLRFSMYSWILSSRQPCLLAELRRPPRLVLRDELLGDL